MEQTPVFENDTGKLSIDLDRLETKVGKIGLNTPEVAQSILVEMDSVSERIEGLENESTRKQAAAQFAGIAGRLRHDAGPFLHDLGGVSALQKMRQEQRPPQDHWWWYLDTLLADRRRSALKRSLIILGGIALALVVLGVIYNRFLAPDPKTAALYGYQQSAQDALTNGDLNQAMTAINEGLTVAPNDPTLLTMRGVVEEKQGNPSAAAQDYAAGQKAFGSKENFLLARAQAYSQAGMSSQSLADAQAVIQLNPASAQAYLAAGNAYETMQQYSKALDMYNKSYDAANASGQTELAAMVKMRQAVVIQMMGAQPGPTAQPGTPTP